METVKTSTNTESLHMLRLYGRGSLSYSSLQQGMEHFTNPELGFIPYERLDTFVHNAVCLGDPICSDEGTERLLDSFLQTFKDPIFLHVSAKPGKVLEKLGFYVNECGVETIIDLPEFSLAGAKKSSCEARKTAPPKTA